ncbi:hypothetical protein D0T90_02925 [Neisseria animalis]|uniref:Uncharacterized protein n=1 Tax=Neisseria animalis TaxID=492 RepID=A0A5P3MPU2_NEIAN|nr:hypothetical protein D0T90_02925 [Neisseria animalis]ROW32727.1 hypothetical protein CGZ60_02545 [Neisseria animalis]
MYAKKIGLASGSLLKILLDVYLLYAVYFNFLKYFYLYYLFLKLKSKFKNILKFYKNNLFW